MVDMTSFTHRIVTNDFVVISKYFDDYRLSTEFAIYFPPFSIPLDFDYDEPDILGSAKWDGCMNWHTDDNCNFHFCDITDVVMLKNAFEAIWVLNEYIIGEKVFKQEWQQSQFNLLIERI